jgi:hypothetical protein
MNLVTMIVLMLNHTWSLEAEVEFHVHPKLSMAVTEPVYTELWRALFAAFLLLVSYFYFCSLNPNTLGHSP